MTLLVADVGSTFTKGRVVDADGGLLWSGQVPTRPRQMDETEAELRSHVRAAGLTVEPGPIPSCSSAAGGLRVVALGLTPGLTYEAALKTALGAGARVVASYAGALTDDDLEVVAREKPDLVLLTAGTDSGDDISAKAFSHALARLDRRLTVVVACNRVIADDCKQILVGGGHFAVVVPNVMPEVGRLDLAGARRAIRDIFVSTVMSRFGDDRGSGFAVIAPTPASVLAATEVLRDVNGRGPVVVVDVGGATTDVHSVFAIGDARNATESGELSNEPSMRTVEADLGMRESATATVEAARRRGFGGPNGLPEGIDHVAETWTHDVFSLDDGVLETERWLCRAAVQLAIERHVGTLTPVVVASGVELYPVGRDLRTASLVMGTGGILSRDRGAQIVRRAMADVPRNGLVPKEPEFLTDLDYMLPCAGVVRERDEALAYRIISRVLERGRKPS